VLKAIVLCLMSSIVKLPIYQIDAFAEKAFEGNPAAVVPLDEWLGDEVMQAIPAMKSS